MKQKLKLSLACIFFITVSFSQSSYVLPAGGVYGLNMWLNEKSGDKHQCL